jgi:hypothetical protein
MAEPKGQPFVCHGKPVEGKPCTTELARGSAWVPALATLRKVVGRWPTVADLAGHTFCGSCAALGRKAGLRFYLHDLTVKELERRRAERTMAARQAFARYCK